MKSNIQRQFKRDNRLQYSLSDLFLIGMMAMLIGYFSTTPFRNTGIRHLFVLGGMLCCLGLSLQNLIGSRLSRSYFVRLAVLVFLLLGGIAFSSDASYVNLLYVSMCYFTLFVILTTEEPFRFTIDVRKLAYRTCIILSVLVLLVSLLPSAYYFEDGRRSGAIVLGMTNPNLTGMLVTSIFNIIAIHYRSSRRKVLLTLLLAALFAVIWLTEARSAIAACIFVTVYTLFFSKKKLPNALVLVFTLLPILFIPLYLRLFEHGASGTMVLGKPLFSGREMTYTDYLGRLDSVRRWLFGDLGRTPFSNAHNAALMILCSIGLVGLFVSYISFIRRLLRLNLAAETSLARIAIAAMLSIYFQSCAEALMFSGIFPSSAFMFLFMLFASSGEEEEEDPE